MSREDRFRLALKAKGWDITDLAKAVGVSQPGASTVVNGKRPGLNLLPKMAEALGVPIDWLTVGSNPPHWASDDRPRAVPTASGRTAIPLQGEVSAGPGEIDIWEAATGDLVMGQHWCAVRVSGDSAYPAVFDRQFAIVDESRMAFMPLDEEHGWDLDDDLVLVRLKDDKRVLLKRFCYHPPDRFVLASANGGRRSPIVEHDDIRCIVPVVAVVYHDPRERGPDRWKAKRAARERETRGA